MQDNWRVAVSGVMGSTSLACWIVLLLPQLIEQWRLKSAKGISIGFISIWFLGDIFNLIGSLWAGLLAEVVFLAVWFCCADFLMIFSYFYYTYMYPKHHKKTHRHPEVDSEITPLVGERRRSSKSRRSSILSDIVVKPQRHSIFIKYVVPILFVIAAGVFGYFISDKSTTKPDDGDIPNIDAPIQLGPQIVGYLSAVLYLGARLPQIYQNYRRKSVEGLSLLFFLFSTFGNLTYAAQILFFRSDMKYVLLNLSWLLGSLGTIFEDSFIFLQFYMYKNNVVEDDEEGDEY